MGYKVNILKDSLAPSGKRLTTFELTYPRFIHSELMTHRMFSRNAASSRAIPVKKLIERVEQDPAIPMYWGKNQKGMQANEEVDAMTQRHAHIAWLEARDVAIKYARSLDAMGLHKQIVNRIIEPWMFITVIVSATEYDNFFHLRCHKDAQPELQWIANEMRHQLYDNIPVKMNIGEWHLPLIYPEDRDRFGLDDLRKMSVGRCARVSYLTHEGKRDPQADIDLHDRLKSGSELESNEPGHWSPFEHVAKALGYVSRSGNFIGWQQYRQLVEREKYNAKSI